MSTVELRLIGGETDGGAIPDVEGIAGGQPEGRMVRLETRASTVDTWYPIGGGVQEKIVPGAFRRSLAAQPEMVLVINHSEGGGLPLAHSKGDPPLEVIEDGEGLLARAELPMSDPDVQSLKSKAARMPLQASFSFRCNRDRWNSDETRREVLEVNLHRADITVCPFGANPVTETSVRGAKFTLEQRQAFRKRIEGRVIGPGFALSESETLTVARRSPEPIEYADLTLAKLKIARARGWTRSW